MSETDNAEKSISLEDVPDIAREYFEAVGEEPDQERLDDIRGEINELEGKRSEIESNAGESNFLLEEIDDEIESLEEEKESLQKSAEDVTQLREDLLRAASESPGFQFTEDWLNPDVLGALTHALYGEEEDEIVVADQTLREPKDAEGLDRMKKIQIKQEIMNIASDRISGYERVEKNWDKLENSRAHPAFVAIAREPGVGPGDIAENLDDTKGTTVRNWTSDLSSKEELKMIHKPKQGSYHPSTVGKYYATHYAELSEEVEQELEEDNEDKDDEGEKTDEKKENSDDPKEDTGQVGLGNSTERSGGQSNESSAGDEGAKVASSKADTTEEKAEAMFSNVGEE